MTPKYSLAVFATVFVMLAGTQALAQTPSATSNAGFLSDYGRLKMVDSEPGRYRYIDTSVNLRPYTKLMIEPVQVFQAPNAEYKGMVPQDMVRITDAFRMEFVGAMLSGYTIVERPGPDVLQVRIALTGIQSTRPDPTASDFIPIKAIFNVARSASGAAPQTAEMSAEVQILDGTGRIVAEAFVIRKSDEKINQEGRIAWKDLQPIAAVWAKAMRQALDAARNYAAPR